MLCRRDIPTAEIRTLPANRAKVRPIGLSKGELDVPDTFFAPLPEELEDMFNGKG